MYTHYLEKQIFATAFVFIFLAFNGFGVKNVLASWSEPEAQGQFLQEIKDSLPGFQKDANDLASKLREKNLPSTVGNDVYSAIQNIIRINNDFHYTSLEESSVVQSRFDRVVSETESGRNRILTLINTARDRLSAANQVNTSVCPSECNASTGFTDGINSSGPRRSCSDSSLCPDYNSNYNDGLVRFRSNSNNGGNDAGVGNGGLGGVISPRGVDAAITNALKTLPSNASPAEVAVAVRGAVLRAGGSAAAANAAANAADARSKGGDPRAAANAAAARVDGGNTSGNPGGSTNPGASGGSNGNTFTGIENPLESGSFLDIIASVGSFLAAFGGAVSVIFILYGGFQMMTSGGDPAKYLLGRKTLLWAAVGLAILASVNTIIIPLLKELLLQ
ncbi:MAG: hypothetical protein HZA36_03635 [Parcubacteria group bacterium]|nr:hypothetical protein [Parcubacteria group bacterium]